MITFAGCHESASLSALKIAILWIDQEAQPRAFMP